MWGLELGFSQPQRSALTTTLWDTPSHILVIDYLDKCNHTQFEFISLPLTATNPALPGFYRISPGGQAAYSGPADI